MTRPRGAASGRRLTGWFALIGVLAALAYLSNAAGDQPENIFYSWDLFVGTLVQDGLVLGILLLIVRGGPARELLALRRPHSWLRAAGWMLVVLVGIWILGVALDPFLNAGEEQGLVPEEWRPEEAAPFAANLVLTVTLVPAVEELLFRGAGYSLLLDRYGKGVAIVGTAVLFGLVHGLVVALPVLVAFGLGLAWLRNRTDSVYPGILLHGLFNGLAILIAVAA